VLYATVTKHCSGCSLCSWSWVQLVLIVVWCFIVYIVLQYDVFFYLNFRCVLLALIVLIHQRMKQMWKMDDRSSCSSDVQLTAWHWLIRAVPVDSQCSLCRGLLQRGHAMRLELMIPTNSWSEQQCWLRLFLVQLIWCHWRTELGIKAVGFIRIFASCYWNYTHVEW